MLTPCLLAQGSYQHGHVEFVQSTEESDTVGVNVRVAYRCLPHWEIQRMSTELEFSFVLCCSSPPTADQ